MVMRLLQKTLGPIRRRISLMVSRAVLTLVNDETTLQAVQAKLLGEETLSALERFQQYGFTSVPFAGAEAVALSLGGNRSHTVIINVDDRRYRLTGLESGEVALYDDRGQRIHLTRTGAVVNVLGTLSVTVSGNIAATVGGDLNATVGGDIAADVGGNLDATVAGETTLECQQTNLTGHLFVGGGLVVAGTCSGSGGALQMQGGLVNIGGDIVSDGVVLDTHVHSGVEVGTENTGEPA